MYYAIILPVVLYWCETCSLTLRGEHKLRVFDNRLLWKIFEQKRNNMMGAWGKLQNEELHCLYSSPSIIRIIRSKMRWAGNVARIGGKRDEYRSMVEKRPIGRPRRRWIITLRWILEK
jgi:hypothetical protein